MNTISDKARERAGKIITLYMADDGRSDMLEALAKTAQHLADHAAEETAALEAENKEWKARCSALLSYIPPDTAKGEVEKWADERWIKIVESACSRSTESRELGHAVRTKRTASEQQSAKQSPKTRRQHYDT